MLQLIQYQEQSNLALTLLVKSQLLDEPLNLDELMCYCLSPVPHCLGTADGFFAKTNKATMLHYVLDDRTEEVPYPKDAFFIQDGNALFHALISLPPTFGDICLQILDQMMAKKNFIFSTDSYQADSIKAQERLRRGFGKKFLVEGPATRKPMDFKLFLANELNKVQFCQLLLKVWGSSKAASWLGKCKTAALIVEGKAHQLVSVNGEVRYVLYTTLVPCGPLMLNLNGRKCTLVSNSQIFLDANINGFTEYSSLYLRLR